MAEGGWAGRATCHRDCFSILSGSYLSWGQAGDGKQTWVRNALGIQELKVPFAVENVVLGGIVVLMSAD